MLRALIVTTFAAGMMAGGWYNPVALIVPKVAFPPTTSLTSQTIVLGLIGTYALNCRVLVTSRDEFAGYTEMLPATCALATNAPRLAREMTETSNNDFRDFMGVSGTRNDGRSLRLYQFLKQDPARWGISYSDCREPPIRLRTY